MSSAQRRQITSETCTLAGMLSSFFGSVLAIVSNTLRAHGAAQFTSRTGTSSWTQDLRDAGRAKGNACEAHPGHAQPHRLEHDAAYLEPSNDAARRAKHAPRQHPYRR